MSPTPRRPWTDADDRALIERFESGVDLVAAQLERTVVACRWRASVLRQSGRWDRLRRRYRMDQEASHG